MPIISRHKCWTSGVDMTFFKDYGSTRILRWTLGALVLAICASAWSQTLPPLTLSETLKLAANQSRQLAAQDAAVAAARETSVSAGQLPDPVLRLGVDNLPVNGPDRFSTTADCPRPSAAPDREA